MLSCALALVLQPVVSVSGSTAVLPASGLLCVLPWSRTYAPMFILSLLCHRASSASLAEALWPHILLAASKDTLPPTILQA
jgi:hypothetical protein